MVEFLNTREDVQWLRDVHLPESKHPSRIGSFMLEGNADWPTRIIVWAKRDPLHTDVGVVYVPNEAGELVRVAQ